MKKTVVIHVGAHKTGTTYLQEALSLSQKYLLDNDILYVHRKDYRQKVLPCLAKIDEAFNEGVTSADDLPIVVKELKNILLPLVDQKNASNIIFSNEAFSGTLWLHNQSRLYPSFDLRIDVLMKVFDDFVIKFAYSIADQSSFLESAALQLLQQGLVNSPFVVLNGAPLTQLSWLPLIDCLEKRVGKDNLCVLSKDMKAISSYEMTFRLLRFVDNDIDLSGLTFKKNVSSVNASFSQKGVDIAMAALSNGGVTNWPKLRKFIQSEYSSVKDQKATLLNASVKELLDGFYNEEILMLQHKYSLM